VNPRSVNTVVNLSNHATDVQQSKYPDEVDEPNGGGDAGEVNVTDLHAGIRLWHYLEQGKKEKRESAGTFSLLCTPPQTSNSEVALSGSSPSGELPQATQSRVYCKCKKKIGMGYCLAKLQMSSRSAKRYPNKLYWSCNKKKDEVCCFYFTIHHIDLFWPFSFNAFRDVIFGCLTTRLLNTARPLLTLLNSDIKWMRLRTGQTSHVRAV
jgi:hypothetical protein